jgi:hypothetical protein
LKRGRIAVLALSMACVAGAALAAQAAAWTRYANSRFGFSIEYPAGSFKPERAPDNGDGRKYRAIRGKARFSVWAGYNALKQTPRQFIEETTATCKAGRASYAVAAKKWAVVSCERRGEVLYAKRLFTGQRMTSFQMTYPAAERDRWDGALARMAESLKPADR